MTELLAVLEGAIAADQRRTILWPAVAALSMAVALVVTILLFRQSAKPTAEQENKVETLTNRAREYGAKANWVFPPEGDKNATALIQILTLEALDDESAMVAHERADVLRGQFATTLIGLGDRYWEDENGKAYARDYYAQAYLFDPENSTARERSGYTIGELKEFGEKANKSGFSKAEVKKARLYTALSIKDDESRAAELAKLIDEDGGLSMHRSQRLLNLAKAPPNEDNNKETEVSMLNQNKTSDELATQGKQAFSTGRFLSAKSLFEESLRLDNRNDVALIGLHDISFDRGDFTRAILYAELAVTLAPRNSRYKHKLGDAYAALARESYKEASKLPQD